MKNKIIKALYITAFIFYICILIYLLFLRRNNNVFDYTLKEYILDSTNLIPFKTIYEFISKLINNRINTSTVIYNLLGNILLFIPMGFFIPSFPKFSADFKKTLITSLIIILSVEILQLFFMVGSFDIDDVILNIIGVIIGYAVYRVYEKIKCNIAMKYSNK